MKKGPLYHFVLLVLVVLVLTFVAGTGASIVFTAYSFRGMPVDFWPMFASGVLGVILQYIIAAAIKLGEYCK